MINKKLPKYMQPTNLYSTRRFSKKFKWKN